MSVSLLKILDVPWEQARAPLRLDLEHIQGAINQFKSVVLNSSNQINPAIIPQVVINNISNTVVNNLIANPGRFQGPQGNDGADGESDSFINPPNTNLIYVPYVGATANVDLGTNSFTLTGTIGIGVAAGTNLLTASKNANNDATIKVTNLSSGIAAYCQLFAVNDAGFFAEEVVFSSGNTGTTYGLPNANLVLYDSNSTVVYGTQGNVNAYIGTQGIIRITVLNTGQVGIGTASPGTTLQINGTTTGVKLILASTGQMLTMNASTGTSAIYERITNTGADTYIGSESSAGGAIFVGTSAYASVIGTANATSFQIATTNTVRVTIDNSGNVSMAGYINYFNGVNTKGLGVPAIYGLDNRTGLSAADGAAITLYTTIAANNIFRVSADIFATAAVTGTATYTIKWTENATSQSMAVTATAINTLGTQSNIIRPDSGTLITAQLTGVFTGTFSVVGLAEQIA